MTPSLLATARGALWLSTDGEIESLSGADAGAPRPGRACAGDGGAGSFPSPPA